MITREGFDEGSSTPTFFCGRIKPMRIRKKPQITNIEPNQRISFHQRLENFGRWQGMRCLNRRRQNDGCICLQSDQSTDPKSSSDEENNRSTRYLLVVCIALLFIMLSSIVEIIQVRSNAKVSHASNSNLHIYADWTECKNPMEWINSSSYLSEYHDRGYPRVVPFNWHPSSSLGKGKRTRKKEGEQYATRLRQKKDHKKKESRSSLSLSFFLFLPSTLLHSAHIR